MQRGGERGGEEKQKRLQKERKIGQASIPFTARSLKRQHTTEEFQSFPNKSLGVTGESESLKLLNE